MATLLDTIGSVAAKARKYGERRLGEQNTKASMIEPLLEALGWDIRDPDEVHREFRPTGRDSPVDYALKLMRRPRLFLEAKGLGETLADRRWIAQVLGYATVAGVEWCVLTDGDEFRFYNATAPIDAEEKMFYKVRLTETEPETAAKMLGLLSRANLEQNQLDLLWVSHFVDRRVKATLRDMLASPNKTLIGLVQRQVPKLSLKEVADSMRRLDIRIESPPIDLARPSARQQTKVGTRQRAAKGEQRARGEGVTLVALIDAGMLKAPTKMFRQYKGIKLEAMLRPDGIVVFQGDEYHSCSTAAGAALASVTGRIISTNGWDFWHVDGEDGSPVSLSKIRADFKRRATRKSPAAKPSRRVTGSRLAKGQ